MSKATVNLTMHAGSVDITPQGPAALFGRAGRTGKTAKIASRLEANCLLISGTADGPAAIIAIDSLYPSQGLSDAVQKNCEKGGLQIAADALMFVASHTHNAPALDDTKPKLGTFDPEYLRHTSEQIACCLLKLNEGASDIASLSSSRAKCPASVYRRRSALGFDLSKWRLEKRTVMAPNPSVGIDEELKLLMLLGDDGAPRCALWSWPCHAVSEPEEMSISADFPGALRDHIRTMIGQDALPVLYFPGFSGDVRPASQSLIPLQKSDKWLGVGKRFGKASTANARRLHGDLKRAFGLAFGSQEHCGTLAEMKLYRSDRTLSLNDIRSQAEGIAPLTCQDWKLGPVRIKAVSSEVASAYKSGSDALIFETGCAGQVFGYLPTDCQLPEGGYEVSGFAPLFSIPGHFKPAIETQIAQLVGR